MLDFISEYIGLSFQLASLDWIAYPFIVFLAVWALSFIFYLIRVK